jgi:hypothetical protein
MQALLRIDEDFSDAPGKEKTMCIVDSGIAFNSPFPAMLRPERKVELILSFDFSQRDGGDKELPFNVSTLHHIVNQVTLTSVHSIPPHCIALHCTPLLGNLNRIFTTNNRIITLAITGTTDKPCYHFLN